jgi:hypothetical protein
VHPATASPTPHDLVAARASIIEAQRILDRSGSRGPAIEHIARDLAHLARCLRTIEEVWFE